MIKIIERFIFSVLSIFLYVSSVYAATSASEYLDGVESGTSQTSLTGWIGDVINVAIGLAALVSAAMLIFSGYMYITANGNEENISKASKSLTWAIVGLVICFIAVILVQFVLDDVIG